MNSDIEGKQRTSARLPVFIFCAALFVIFSFHSYSQTTWTRTYGGGAPDYWTNMARQTSDGGYVVAGGWVDPAGSGRSDSLVMRLDSSGAVLWQKTYGGTEDDWISSIRQTSDGGYIVAGGTDSFGARAGDLWIFKLDQEGSVTWEKMFGEANSDWANSVQQTSDGGYVAAGWMYQPVGTNEFDLWVLKLDAAGGVQWQKTIGGEKDEWATSICQTADGGYIVAGYKAGSGKSWVIRLDSQGAVQWQKAYGGAGAEWANSIQQTSDGGFIVAGATSSFSASGDSDLWIFKLDQSGGVEWQKTYGDSHNDWANSIQQTVDGGYIVAGMTNSTATGLDNMWALKIDPAGAPEWQKTFGEARDGSLDFIQQTSDEGYIMTGSPRALGGGWVMKLDPSGSMDPSCGFVADTALLPLNSSGASASTSAAASTVSFAATRTSSSVAYANAAVDLVCFGGECPPITLSPANLPNAVQGSSYSTVITATGGKYPYVYSITGGSFPGGLSLSAGGQVSGIPSEKGVFSFTVTAADSGECSGFRSFELRVNSAQSPVISSVKKLSSPFRLKLIGSNFKPDDSVYIGTDTAAWTGAKYKSAGEIILKSGAALKAKFPKGVSVEIRVVNLDGESGSIKYIR